jgi:hypothetical protein
MSVRGRVNSGVIATVTVVTLLFLPPSELIAWEFAIYREPQPYTHLQPPLKRGKEISNARDLTFLTPVMTVTVV